MESFQELGLPAFLGESLKRMNFDKPTPVQAQAIPSALLGKDVIASAQTGTGKTAAFGIPLLAFLENNKDQTALILTPTRELAMQVLEVLRQLTGKHFLGGSVLLIGGANMGTQLAALTRKPRLFIGTPGRVIDHLNRGSLNLSKSGFLVLDEADRMLDMGFEPQLELIRKRLPEKRQALLFSATIPPDIQAMASRYLKDPVRITVGSSTQPIPKISQMIVHTTEANKPGELSGELKERQGSILVFARTQHRVDRIAARLKEEGLKVTRIHGGRTQSQRKQAIDQFRLGNFLILVATDIAARGLDIHHIAHVINYDLPRNPEDYIHRVGRTARAGAEGSALCFLTPEDRDLWSRILRLMKLPTESIQVKSSRFGNFTPRADAPRSHAPHGHPKQNQVRGHRPNREFQQRGPSQGPARPQPHGHSRPQGAGGEFRQGRKDFQIRDGHRQQHSGGRPSDGRPHQPRERRPMNDPHGFKSPNKGNFIFHGKDEGRQPDQHETREWKPMGRTENKPGGFFQKLGQKFSGGARPDRDNRGGRPGEFRSRDQRPHSQGSGGRPGEHRPGGHSQGPRPGGHSTGEHRPHRPSGPHSGGDRPHRSGKNFPPRRSV